MLAVGGEDFAHPLTEGRGSLAKVDRHFEDLAFLHAHEFALRLLDLVMQATQRVLGAATVVVLHEPCGFAAGLFKLGLVEACRKEVTVVSEDSCFYESTTSGMASGVAFTGIRSP